MAALICDICGGNLVMDASGETAVCESCGMKHSKDRVKAKVQEIKGVVEVTKGEAEKERLLKNAETFLSLLDIERAKEIYKQLTEEYPNDSRGWAGLVECCFSLLPKEYNKDELSQADREFSDIYFELIDAQKKAIMLNKELQQKFDDLWKKHGDINSSYSNELINRYQSNDRFEDVLLQLLYPNYYIPRSIEPLLSSMREKAMQFEEEISTSQSLSRIYNIDISCVKAYMDSVYGIQKIDTSPVEHIEYLAPCEAIVSYCKYGEKKLVYIQFEKSYSVKELVDKILIPTTLEGQRIKNLQIINNFFLNISNASKEDFIKHVESVMRGRNYNKKEDDSFRTTFNIYNIRANISTDITDSEPMLTINYDYSIDEYCKITKRSKRSTLTDMKLVFIGSKEELDMTKTFCINKGLCVHCGVTFKGVFNKVCSKCGKPKDY